MKRVLVILIIIVAVIKLEGQDYQLSQPQESPIMLNPANAGLRYPSEVVLNYRQQWRSISKPYTTLVGSFDAKVLSQGRTGSSLGVGLLIIQDQAGTGKLSTMNANLAIMGKVMLNDMQTLSGGVIGGVMQRKLDINSLTWTDQYNGMSYDGTIPSGETFSSEKRMSADVGAGIQWSYGKGASTLSSNDAIGAQVGFAAYHLNMPNTGFKEDADRRYIRMVVHGSFSYGIKNTPFQINPVVVVQMQGPSRLYYGGLYYRYRLQEGSKYTGNLLTRTISLGTFYRVGDSFVTILALEWDKFAVGISYDVNISGLTKATSGRGGTEVSLKYLPFKTNQSNKLL